MRWRVRSLAISLAIWINLPHSALAHVELLGAEPTAGSSLEQPPTEVRLYFSETVAPALTDVSILDARGRRLDKAPSRIDSESGRVVSADVPEIGPGVYTVAYRALSAVDGHIDRGVISFAVGTNELPSGQTASEIVGQPELWTTAVLRWFSYLAALLMLGLCVFRLLVIAPNRSKLTVDQRERVDFGLGRLLSVSAMVLVVSCLAQLLQQATELADDRSIGAVIASVENLFVRTRYGAIWLARISLGVAALSLIRAQQTVPEPERAQRWGGTAILAGLALYTVATLSHSASAIESAWLGLLLSWAHLASVAVWFGGAVALTISAQLGLLQPLVGRFSRLAFAAFTASVLTGFGQVVVLVGDPRAAIETLPGQLLLAKITVVAGIAYFAWRARRFVDRASTAGRLDGIERNTRREVRLGALALAITALLVYLPPAWQTYQQQIRSRSVAVQSLAGDLTWSLRIDPGRPGENEITLQPPPELRGRLASGRLLATYQDDELPPIGARFDSASPDALVTRGQILTVSGRWLVESVVRLDDGDDILVRSPVELAGPGTPVPPPPVLRGGALTASVLVALTLVGLGLAMLVFVVRTLGTRTGEARGLIAATVAIMLLGTYVALRPAPSEAVTNLNLRRSVSPVPSTEASLVQGGLVYAQACADCHGATGRGDGPRVTGRGERLADLRLHLSAGHTDGDLYYWITNGIGGTEMPAFGAQLSDEDRWNLVNAIRALAADRSN
jgi:copper transport protein